MTYYFLGGHNKIISTSWMDCHTGSLVISFLVAVVVVVVVVVGLVVVLLQLRLILCNYYNCCSPMQLKKFWWCNNFS